MVFPVTENIEINQMELAFIEFNSTPAVNNPDQDMTLDVHVQ